VLSAVFFSPAFSLLQRVVWPLKVQFPVWTSLLLLPPECRPASQRRPANPPLRQALIHLLYSVPYCVLSWKCSGPQCLRVGGPVSRSVICAMSSRLAVGGCSLSLSLAALSPGVNTVSSLPASLNERAGVQQPMSQVHQAPEGKRMPALRVSFAR